MDTIMSFTTKKEKEKGLLTEHLDPADFDAGVLAYDGHAGRLRLPGGQTLKGLRIDREDIEDLFLNANVSHLYLRFIISPVANHVTIAVGGSVATAAHPDGECDKNNLYDYCEPCPTVCAVFV